MENGFRVLVAPLHWGLGHATRCVPIIEALLARGFEVVLASDGAALLVLREHFPQCEWVELPSYGIRYDSGSMVWNMAKQLPRILRAMRLERLKLDNIIDTHKINAVISDNRYGFFSRRVPVIFVTHQLYIRVPCWMRWLVSAVNRRLIGRCAACWVPDEADEHLSLSGELSHPAWSGVRYVGALSRLGESTRALPCRAGFVLIVLSGPEPQRSFLEAELREQVANLLGAGYEVLLVLGKVGLSGQWAELAAGFWVCDYLGAEELAAAMGGARVVVARSGYSTLMDVQAMGVRHLLLVPTPGQTEQEYLAERLRVQGRAAVEKQGSLDMLRGVVAAEACETGFAGAGNSLGEAVDALWSDLAGNKKARL